MTDNGFAAIGLHNPKNAINVGHVLRAADCYGANLVTIQGDRHSESLRTATDTTKAIYRIPVIRTADLRSVIPFNCVPVAVELVPNAESLVTYQHPRQAYYIFGAEDATLGQKVLSWCRDVIYVPTNHCMNLSATVNTVLYDRLAKQTQSANQQRDLCTVG